MQSNGTPVTINLSPHEKGTIRYVEDIKVPSGCQL